MMRKLLPFTLLLMLATLAACGGGDTPTESDTPVPNDDTTTNENASAASVELTETYSDEVFAISYPSGYTVEGAGTPGTVTITNVEGFDTTAPPTNVASGQVLTQILISPRDALGVVEGVNLASIAEPMATSLAGDSSDLTTGEIVIGDGVGLSYSGSANLGTVEAGLYMVFLDFEDAGFVAIIAGFTASGEEGQITDIINGMAGSITFVDAGDATDTEEDSDGEESEG